MKKKKKQTQSKGMNTRTAKTQRAKAVVSVAKSDEDAWERLMKLREKLGKGWQSKKSSVEILSEMRR